MDECRAGQLCLGTLVQDVGTLALTTLGASGLSFVFLDMMHGTLSWKDVRDMSTAARAAGMTSVVRIPNYPWGEVDGAPEGRIAADAAHAAALGADGVRCSVRDVHEARMLASIANDWHRVPNLVTTADDFRQAEDSIRRELILMPIIESARALADLEEIMAIDAVNAVMLSGTDLPRELLDVRLEYEHDDVWQYVDDAVALGAKHGVAVGLNTGFTYTGITETVSRIRRIREHGVNFVLLQTLDHIVYAYSSAVVDGARRAEGGERA
jgi:2-keto-3-deoxy-L-rhamnonate aldolase RhmA